MEQPLNILKRYWGFNSFRALQEPIIQSVLQGHDTLALLPTGGGKSICFQVPALARDGICIVVSPLIALMRDQVEALQQRGVKATAVYSGMSKREIDVTLDNCAYGNYKFLYVSPERLETDIFRERVKKMEVNLLAVDEAHCISEWGYDFRPSYLNIANIRTLIPKAPVLALTATATPDVKQDIRDKLVFENGQTFQGTFERSNLVYGVLNEEGKSSKLLELLHRVRGSGIVYVKTRKSTISLSDFLQKNGISAEYYHGGLDAKTRFLKQERWKKGQTRIMTATNAFGMGIDKPDVRLVIHMHLPDSLEAYYQEAGRCGRDGQRAYPLIIVNKADELEVEERIEKNFPSIDDLKTVYHALGNFYQIPIGSGHLQTQDLDIKQFANRYDIPLIKAFNALKILEREGYIVTTESVFLPSRVHMKMDYRTLYQFQVENPGYDTLLKTILRSYEGVFDYYVKIDEGELGKRLEIKQEELVKTLNQLKKFEVLDYIPRKDLPQFMFLEPRMEKEQLELDEAHINQRKAIYESKLRSVLHYAFYHTDCRSQFLLDYFGETMEKRCGHCDFCLKEKRKEANPVNWEKLHQKIKNLLTETPLSYANLKTHFPKTDEKSLKQVLRWMYDQEEIHLDQDQLSLKSKEKGQ